MPEVLINCVNESVATIFETIIGDRPEYRGDDEDKMVGDGVVGIISFVGDVTWLMMLALPRKTANHITQRFCGFDVDYDSPDMGDVVGELANVLAGDVVARLGGEGVKVAMSLPTILRGKNVEPLLPRGLPHKKMHFSLPEGELMIKIAGARQGETVGRAPGS
ncbi:MAG: chemotaxis protein CheX [Nitrospinaceae bacterium]